MQVNARKQRWAEHRENRRLELIGAAIEAAVHYGPSVDMDQVAKVAGVSKPVLYRYFADKTQLWLAVGEFVAQQVLAVVTPAIESVREERELIAATIDAYLGAIEDQAELYRCLMKADVPGVHHLINGASQTVATGLSRVIGDRLRALGLDAGPAEPWAVGIVGLVQTVGDWWMARNRPMRREALTDYLTTLLWHGIEGVKAAADMPASFAAPAERAAP
ncbi:TetR family transcriptional regulator [Catelliglobosispora koreensis]|uniref:TetR family transcriptional regulator n=1 Tax=Catelliglobosispora koreensis TaxID=129052 RepID=UPI00038039C2|nr:TetR family transcriptional regulator [Catelliglobosispora koreensis]